MFFFSSYLLSHLRQPEFRMRFVAFHNKLHVNYPFLQSEIFLFLFNDEFISYMFYLGGK